MLTNREKLIYIAGSINKMVELGIRDDGDVMGNLRAGALTITSICDELGITLDREIFIEIEGFDREIDVISGILSKEMT